MKIEIKIQCDCETEFSVKVPDACLEPNNKNPFVLNCPYCQGDINYKFHIEKINQAEYDDTAAIENIDEEFKGRKIVKVTRP